MLQLHEKIIPAFKKAHGPGYQALIMVDNSQGHSAYAEDALLVSRMNIIQAVNKPGCMTDGIAKQQESYPAMNFPSNHSEHPMSQRA